MPIQRLFIANRGEAAVRIARTCRRLGVESVGAVEPGDRGSLHTRVVDATAEVTSYLSAAAVVDAAVASSADAVHPGWGFLAEQPALAEAVLDAGLEWVGPPPAAMRLAGDKLEAKRAAASVGLPTLRSGTAAEVGLPLMIKAAAGGGGRGMRVVREPAELDEALESARREALAGSTPMPLTASRTTSKVSGDEMISHAPPSSLISSAPASSATLSNCSSSALSFSTMT